MISIKEVSKDKMQGYWELHFEYLASDILPHDTLGTKLDEEDMEYFKSKDYRGVLESYMDREPDKAHFIYFYKDGLHIGCTQYVIYKSEDGKCFVMDFWVLPEYRGSGVGHACYSALENYVKADGGAYIEINISSEENHKFWTTLGFSDDGFDEGGNPLMRNTF